jgi:hypothetical protein
MCVSVCGYISMYVHIQSIPATTVYVHGVDVVKPAPTALSHPARTVTVPGVLHVKVPASLYVCLLHVAPLGDVHPSVVVCVCMYVCVSIYMYVCVYIYVRVCVFVLVASCPTGGRASVCGCMCMYVCIHVCMCVYICVCVCASCKLPHWRMVHPSVVACVCMYLKQREREEEIGKESLCVCVYIYIYMYICCM